MLFENKNWLSDSELPAMPSVPQGSHESGSFNGGCYFRLRLVQPC